MNYLENLLTSDILLNKYVLMLQYCVVLTDMIRVNISLILININLFIIYTLHVNYIIGMMNRMESHELIIMVEWLKHINYLHWLPEETESLTKLFQSPLKKFTINKHALE